MKNVNERVFDLDETDRSILDLLMQNSKHSLAFVSKSVGISTTAVHQRIKKMEQQGIIKDTIAQLDPRKIGYKVTAYIGLDLERPGQYQEAIKVLKDFNEVVEAHYTTGNYTIFLKVLTQDNDHLMKMLSKIQKLNGVLRTETFISLEQSISRQLKVK